MESKMVPGKIQATAIVAIEWIIFIFAVLFAAILCGIYFHINRELKTDEAGYTLAELQVKVMLIILGIFLFIMLVLNVSLSIGVLQGNTTACKAWYLTGYVFLAFCAIDLLWAIIDFKFWPVVIPTIFLLYRLYAVRIVVSFSNALNPPPVPVKSRAAEVKKKKRTGTGSDAKTTNSKTDKK